MTEQNAEQNGAQQDVEELRARIALLEVRNEELQAAADAGADAARSQRSKGRGRAAVAVVLLLVSVLLAPIAVLGTWARLQLVDTDRFVQTFAPLAHEPAVQSFVADQAVQGIEQNVDIDGLVGDLFSGIETLDLPPRAKGALPLLEGAAAQGVRSLISTGADRLVQSPQFAVLWEGTLRETHSRAIAVIQGDDSRAIQLSDDGALTLELSVVIREVKQYLVKQGIGIADSIPVIDRSIPILASDSLVLVRTVYQVAVAAGYWLPWVVLGMLVAGVIVARKRMRALAWAGAGLTASLLLLAAGLGIGRQFFIGAVSPSVMPSATASVVFDQLTDLISSTLLALVVLSLIVAVGAWLAGASRPARAIRQASDKGFSTVRRQADSHELGTGSFGRFVERWRSALLVGTVLIGVLVLFARRPIELGGVVTTLLIVVLVLVAIEVVRRPLTVAAAGGSLAGEGTITASADEARQPDAARSGEESSAART